VKIEAKNGSDDLYVKEAGKKEENMEVKGENNDGYLEVR
jgi:hypothetical protein